jgi:hypothetical protein
MKKQTNKQFGPWESLLVLFELGDIFSMNIIGFGSFFFGTYIWMPALRTASSFPCPFCMKISL